MKPVYEMAVMNVRRLYPTAQDARLSSGDRRFRNTLREVLWQEYSYRAEPDEMDSCIETFRDLWEDDLKPRFIPDLWSIDVPEKTVHLYEIEDTHPLTEKKLMQFHDLWWALDGRAWSLKVVVFDRYGLNPRSLDMVNFAFHMLPVLDPSIPRPYQTPEPTTMAVTPPAAQKPRQP